MGPIAPINAIRIGAELRNQRSSVEQAMCLGAREFNGGAPTVREGYCNDSRHLGAMVQ